MKKTIIIIFLILFIWLIMASCGSGVVDESVYMQSRAPRAIILDFHNLSGIPEFDNLGLQISERLQRELQYSN